ncbi:MAG: hypothetical protein ACYC5G_04370 [Candidatus Doudnabacteria bacterium]
MIFYEETKTRDPSDTSVIRARGKVVWLNEQQIKKLIPLFGYVFDGKFGESIINTLKAELMSALKKKGFVFFDTCVYRYTLHKNGKLKEFGIQIHHIN